VIISNNKSIKEVEDEIIEAFSWFETWEEKYEYIIELGKKLPVLDDKHKLEENIIKGCQSTVWLVADFREGKVFYHADSDAIIVKGLISMLISVLSGHPPDEILGAKLDFIREIGMMTHLAQTRSNGLVAMVKQIKNYALAFKSISMAEKTI
jgi:cysteine desulfuration protein SufE